MSGCNCKELLELFFGFHFWIARKRGRCDMSRTGLESRSSRRVVRHGRRRARTKRTNNTEFKLFLLKSKSGNMLPRVWPSQFVPGDDGDWMWWLRTVNIKVKRRWWTCRSSATINQHIFVIFHIPHSILYTLCLPAICIAPYTWGRSWDLSSHHQKFIWHQYWCLSDSTLPYYLNRSCLPTL